MEVMNKESRRDAAFLFLELLDVSFWRLKAFYGGYL
jgi:hypothetical protein